MLRQQCLIGIKTSRDPVSTPLVDGVFIRTKLMAQILQNAAVVHGMNITAHQRSQGAHMSACFRGIGQQRWLRVALFQPFNDGGRLGQHFPTVQHQGGNQPLGVYRGEVRLQMRFCAQIDRNVLRADTFEVERNAQAVGSATAKVVVVFHGCFRAQIACLAGRIVPQQLPKPMRAKPCFSHQPRRTTASPSSRKVRCSPLGSCKGFLPPLVNSISAPA